ncbi:MAG: AAA family ATPase [Ignavibacteria bacterium]|nr:AAA family ATPase [Ignavibacteria bacterium]
MLQKKAHKPKELKYSDLRWRCNPSTFDFTDTKNITPIDEIVGQERALEALKVGVDIKAPGYNIYIAGLAGTGKTTTIQQMLESLSTSRPQLYDYVYVNNFEDPDHPILLVMKAGEGRVFRKEISDLISFLRERIPHHLESENYLAKRKQIIEKYKESEQELFQVFEKKLKKDGFALGEVQVGESVRPDIIPIINDEAVPVYQLSQLVSEKKLKKEHVETITKKYQKYQEELIVVFKKGMKINLEMQEKANNLERGEVSVLLEGALRVLYEKYKVEKIVQYLSNIKKSVLENLQFFKEQKGGGDEAPEGYQIDYFHDYEVNIILDNSNTTSCPVVVEISPTYTNLFGTIEKISDGRGNWYADFSKIKAGSLLKANGGYLVLRAIHLFEEPGVWRTLKRILNYRKLEIQDSPYTFSWAQSMLKPEPIEINTKVILMGNNYIYYLLSGYEDDFKKIFKIKADFDSEITRTEEIMIKYTRVIKKLIQEENLREFDRTAVAYLLELASRYAGHKEKLTTRFSFLADIAREADYWAKRGNSKVVKQAHVKTAFYKARERHALSEDKMSESILDNTILIESCGERIGCLNGLAVYGNDYYSFGKPVRITATVGMGSGSIINVEREAGLSGKIHDKGMLIINGFFKETFGRHAPLSFSANIVFEQSYGQIDGDSASAAEIFTLLSTLADIPLKQSIAVTGSVNQKGEIQPIGGVNEKIEGFYDVCNSRGLTGIQGVVIPHQNVKELMLRDDIVEAVKKRQFHIYPMARIEEGIEILTGIKAGMRDAAGVFEAGTVFGIVEDQLRKLYEKAKNPYKEKNEKKMHSKNKSGNRKK